MWIKAVWEVLTEQVTLKHFLMKVIYEHDKTFKWEYYTKNKCVLYPSSKVTTFKGFLCFFQKMFYETPPCICVSLSLLKVHKRRHTVHTLPLLLTCVGDVFYQHV